jgi:glycosyltransferase involved in cell wall biosynthesis
MVNEEEEYCFFESKAPACTTHKVSIIVPTHNASQHIATTIESILNQRDARFEAIFIDAESKDRTVEIIRSYEDPRFRVQSVPSSKLFEMVNRGIAMAQGEYINILLPGDSYLYPDVLSLAMWHIVENDFPELFYSACFVRNEWYEPHFLFRPLSDDYLRQGLQPSNMQSMWIKKSVFKSLGYFDTHLENKGFLDFLIRFSRHPEYLFSSEMRVFIDPLVVTVPYTYIIKNFSETFQLILRHYGVFWAMVWFCAQKEIKRLVMRAIHRLKNAFQG